MANDVLTVLLLLFEKQRRFRLLALQLAIPVETKIQHPSLVYYPTISVLVSTRPSQGLYRGLGLAPCVEICVGLAPCVEKCVYSDSKQQLAI